MKPDPARTKTEHAEVRRFYYLSTIGLVIFLALLVDAISLYLFFDEYQERLESNQAKNLKSAQLVVKAEVQRTIQEIDLERDILAKNSGFSSFRDVDPETRRKIDASVQENMKVKIGAYRFPNEGYLWINKVLKWEGGDGYALRLVHPNLKQSEGALLSTATKDMKGNSPYLDELEGIKKNGEVFLHYWFKKLDSDEIGEKISYAALYKDFDWIIAAGAYIEDLEAQVVEERELLSAGKDRQLLVSLGATFAILLGAIGVIFTFEKKLGRLIRLLRLRLERRERHLQAEQKKTQDAYQELKLLADKDPLSGLLNRRAMLQHLDILARNYAAGGDNYYLLMIDADHFKLINDTFGHEAGDQAIKAISIILMENIRGEDQASRWGGEEFLVVLSGISRLAAYERAEKIRLLLSGTGIPNAGEDGTQGTSLHVTATIGLTEGKAGESVVSAISRADSALYKGKHSGRNKVVEL